MLKQILAVVALVITAPVWAQSPDVGRWVIPSPLGVVLQVGRWIVQDQDLLYEVTVQGTGDTLPQAQDQAYRTAVQQALGSLVLTQSQLSQNELRRNDILVYSSGFVDRFEIVKRAQDARGQTVVDMRVWIRRSAIADGLFGSSTGTGQIDSARISASVQTLRRERSDADGLLEAVLREFPARSFRVNIVKTGWALDRDRNSGMAIDFTLEWHDPWIRSLREAMSKTTGVSPDHACSNSASQCQRERLAYVLVQMRPGTWGLQQVAAWPDNRRLDLLREHLVDRGLSLDVRLMSPGGEILQRQCVRPPQVQNNAGWGDWLNLMQPTRTGVDIWAWARNSGRILMHNVSDSALSQLGRVEISVVKHQHCG